MTTKQPPAQKHLPPAYRIIDSLLEKLDKVFGNHWGHKEVRDYIYAELRNLIPKALAETEAEALASKVVGPSDDSEMIKIAAQSLVELNDKKNINNSKADYFVRGALWYRSQLNLAPNEPEVKAVTYELTGETYYIKDKGTVYTAMTTCECTRDDLSKLIGTTLGNKVIIGVESFCVDNQSFKKIGLLVKEPEVKAQGFDLDKYISKAACDHADKLTTTMEIENLSREEIAIQCYERGANWYKENSAAFLAGHANALAQSKAATLKLPEKKKVCQSQPQAVYSENEGYNAAIDDMRKLNGLESV